LKVLKQCLLDLVIKILLREGKALGSEEGKGVSYEQRKEVE
jgi:hypothetical protein